MNPMIRKELWQRMREPRGWVILSVYLAALGAAVALAYFSQVEEVFYPSPKEIEGAEIGVSIFVTVVFAQLSLLLLLAPVFSAGGITIEKEQRTLSALLTSLLTPLQIWWGKFSAAMLYLMLLLFSSLPILGLSFAMGGIQPRDLLKAVAITLFVLACVVAMGLYCSSLFRRSVHSTAAAYGMVIALTVLTTVAFAIEQSFREKGPERAADIFPGFTPLFLNPYFPVGTLLFDSPTKDWYPLLVSLLYFAGIGILAVALTLRNLERSGEQV